MSDAVGPRFRSGEGPSSDNIRLARGFLTVADGHRLAHTHSLTYTRILKAFLPLVGASGRLAWEAVIYRSENRAYVGLIQKTASPAIQT
jgi:hypothetical protein